MTIDGLSAETLGEVLRAGPTEVITIDVRPFSDYVVGHIAGAFSVRLSSILIRRLATGKIPFIDIVADAQKDRFRQWSSTGCKRYVVYDEGVSDSTASDPKSPLCVVAKSLIRDDNIISILQGLLPLLFTYSQLLGGFAAFKLAFPAAIESSDDEPLSHLGSLTHGVVCAVGAACDGEHSPIADKSVRDNHPSEILSYLYVGSQQHAQNKIILDGIRVTHILNITATCPNWFPTAINYKTIQIKVRCVNPFSNSRRTPGIKIFLRTLRMLLISSSRQDSKLNVVVV